MNPLANVIITGLELIAIIFTYDAYFCRRIANKHFWMLVCVIFPIHYLIVQTFTAPIGYIKIFVISILLLLINIALYRGSLILRILITTIAYALLCLVEFFGQYVFLFVMKMDFETYFANQRLYSACGIILTIICIGAAFWLKTHHNPVSLQMGGDQWGGILSLIFPIASLIVQFPLFYLVITQRLDIIWVLLSCSVMILCNLFVIWVINLLGQNMQIQKSSLILNERIEIQAENIEALSAAYTKQRRMTHDFQQYLLALSEMMRRGKMKEAFAYLEQLRASQTERTLLVNTHNAAMDAILNQKAYLAKKENIDIHFEVNDLSKLKIRSVDYTVVIANLMDNAIEACQKLSVSERWITAKILYDAENANEPSKLFVSIMNSSLPVTILNDVIASTKENPELHGFGIPNVKEIISKYNAISIMQYEGGCFQFTIEWPE